MAKAGDGLNATVQANNLRSISTTNIETLPSAADRKLRVQYS